MPILNFEICLFLIAFLNKIKFNNFENKNLPLLFMKIIVLCPLYGKL